MRVRLRGVAIWTGVTAGIAGVAIALFLHAREESGILRGVVLRQDSDPRKQLPIANVRILAGDGSGAAEGVSDVSGLFRLKLPYAAWRQQPLSLSFQHSGYQTINVKPPVNAGTVSELYVVRMEPISSPATIPEGGRQVVKDVRIRYAERTTTTANVGSIAKTFTVMNTGNVPCANQPPCSPDGRWKAAIGGVTVDAGPGQQFKNARVSCIAGPCPFTKIETGAVPQPGRTITVRVRDWSETATFLLEAEVTRDRPIDTIQQAYPAIYGASMSFTLPAGAEGLSIQADLDGSEIVFPLGPALRLSWAECSLQVAADQTQLYRCELKPGYEFQ